MRKYRFLGFAAKVFRVIAWLILIVGVVGSVVIAIGMLGLLGEMSTVTRILIAAAGVIGSVVAWIFLLAIRELLYLLMDLEENTRMTAERIAIATRSKRD